jgi:hypothetical protein
MLLKVVWLTVWPGVCHHLANLVVQNSIPKGVEVEACEEEEESVNTVETSVGWRQWGDENALPTIVQNLSKDGIPLHV